jgi:hypothetical protein
MLPQETLALEQKAFLKGRQKFVIHPDGDLEISFSQLTTHREFRVPLWQINPKSARHKYQQTGNWIGLLIFGAITLGFLWGVIGCLLSRADKDVGYALMIPLACVGTIACICFWRLRTQSVNAVIFYMREGGQIHIWHENPDAQSFGRFCEALSKRSEKAWNDRPIEPAAQSIAGEIAALKRLKDSGVLSDTEFERAKAKLLAGEEPKRIGF